MKEVKEKNRNQGSCAKHREASWMLPQFPAPLPPLRCGEGFQKFLQKGKLGKIELSYAQAEPPALVSLKYSYSLWWGSDFSGRSTNSREESYYITLHDFYGSGWTQSWETFLLKIWVSSGVWDWRASIGQDPQVGLLKPKEIAVECRKTKQCSWPETGSKRN